MPENISASGAVGSDFDSNLASRGANGPSGSSDDAPTGPILIGGVGSDFDGHTAARGADGPSGP